MPSSGDDLYRVGHRALRDGMRLSWLAIPLGCSETVLAAVRNGRSMFPPLRYRAARMSGISWIHSLPCDEEMKTSTPPIGQGRAFCKSTIEIQGELQAARPFSTPLIPPPADAAVRHNITTPRTRREILGMERLDPRALERIRRPLLGADSSAVHRNQRSTSSGIRRDKGRTDNDICCARLGLSH